MPYSDNGLLKVVIIFYYTTPLHCKKRGVTEHPRGAIFYCFRGNSMGYHGNSLPWGVPIHRVFYSVGFSGSLPREGDLPPAPPLNTALEIQRSYANPVVTWATWSVIVVLVLRKVHWIATQ